MKRVVIAVKREVEEMEVWLTEEKDGIWLRAKVGSLTQVIFGIKHDGQTVYPNFGGSVGQFLGCRQLGKSDE